MKAAFKILSLFGFLVLASCSHALHQYHVGDLRPVDFSQNKHERVTAEASQSVVLGFVYDTDYVDQAYLNLQKKCPDKVLTGINTRYSTSHGFLHWTNKVKMTGFCLGS